MDSGDVLTSNASPRLYEESGFADSETLLAIAFHPVQPSREFVAADTPY